MRFKFFIIISLCFNLLFIMSLSVFAGSGADYDITITAPEAGSRYVNIWLEDIGGAGFDRAEARLGDDGAWHDISDGLRAIGRAQFEIHGSGTVYAAITDPYGNVHVKSLYVELGEVPAVQPEPPLKEKSVTPVDGSATVVENSVKAPGEREFYTIQSEKGNDFFIVVDKEKPDKNVYLLAEVTENGLLGLTKPEIITPPAPDPLPDVVQPEPQPESPPSSKNTSNTGSIFLIVIVALVCGGAGYYFKILRPKQNADSCEDDDDGYNEEESEQDEDDEYDGYELDSSENEE